MPTQSAPPLALPTYIVRRLKLKTPSPAAMAPNDPAWRSARVARIASFHAASTTRRPAARLRLLYDDTALFGRFDVTEPLLLARHTLHQSLVCQDSCVELFLQPAPHSGYFNFEFNALGTMQVFYIVDPACLTHIAQHPAPNTVLSTTQLSLIRTATTLQAPIPKPTSTRTKWSVSFSIDWNLIRHFVPAFTPSGTCRANFYKCGDLTPLPHWASWSDIGEHLSFHQPHTFGVLEFQPNIKPSRRVARQRELQAVTLNVETAPASSALSTN